MLAESETVVDGDSPSQRVAKPKRQTVIYLFTLVGFAYAGKRDVALRHDVAAWPTTGMGRLPDGYSGSGGSRFDDLVGWSDIKREHGIENAAWWIVEVLLDADEKTVEAAERDAIAGTRAVYGDRCVNYAKGGGGHSPESARRAAEKRVANPVWRANVAEAMRANWQDEEFRARHAAILAERNANPEFRARWTAQVSAQWQDEDFRARNAAATRANWEDEDFRARHAAASRIANRASAPITAPQNIVTVLKSDPTGSFGNGRAVFAHCKTGMTIGEVRAACEAAGLRGGKDASSKTDDLVA